MKNSSLERTLRCPACNERFELVGENGAEKLRLKIHCPYCGGSVLIQWPVSGIVFVRYIPEER